MEDRKKKCFRLRFWKKKKEDAEKEELQEVELTKKDGVLNLHALLLAQEQGETVAEEVTAEEDDITVRDQPTRYGIVNTENPVVRDGVTKFFKILLHEINEVIDLLGEFRNSVDFLGTEALLEIQLKLTEKMEQIVIDGGSSDEEEILNESDIQAILLKFKAYLSQRFDEAQVLEYERFFTGCLQELNNIVIEIDTEGENNYGVALSEAHQSTINQDNIGAEEDEIADQPTRAALRCVLL